MKKLSIFYLIVASVFIFSACEEIEKAPLSSDDKAPQPISLSEVKNEPGGATITYRLPDETDLLYIKAQYELKNGKKVETRSSVYMNSIIVEGYGDTLEHVVNLYTVDRSENVSSPVEVTIKPETPAVYSVQNTVEMSPDFGGVQYTWLNANNAPLSFMILAPDSTGALYPVEVVYSSVSKGKYSLRGFGPEEQTFGIIIRDRWDNFSDSLKMNFTPMFEEKLDKSKFNRMVLPGDTDMDAWGMRYESAYDDDPLTFNHSFAGTGWPQYFTLDLGVTARLSRLNALQRTDSNFGYGQGNPRLFEIWGIAEEPPADGGWDGWTKLKDCVATRPSLQGGTVQEDQEHLDTGDEYSFTLDDPPVRYIRILVNETWGMTGYIYFAELTFYGQVIGNEN